MAATWNPEVDETEVRKSPAMETRAPLVFRWSFSPVLDIGRQPLWPRFYEKRFGEDPVSGESDGAWPFVRGLEGSDVGFSGSCGCQL